MVHDKRAGTRVIRRACKRVCPFDVYIEKPFKEGMMHRRVHTCARGRVISGMRILISAYRMF